MSLSSYLLSFYQPTETSTPVLVLVAISAILFVCFTTSIFGASLEEDDEPSEKKMTSSPTNVARVKGSRSVTVQELANHDGSDPDRKRVA
mgnify:CR=1 FL=1